MPFQSSTFNVLVASPSDLTEERKAAREAIHEWNDLNAEAEGVNLMPLMWETHAMPEAGGRPQEIINKQLVAKSDLLIGLFWTKMGTNTGVAESGTVEEINEIVGAGKPAMLYFSNRPVNPQNIDVEQMQRLNTFREETYRKALAGTFASPDELRQTLVRDLTRRVRMLKAEASATRGARVKAADVEKRRQYAAAERANFEQLLRTNKYYGFRCPHGILAVTVTGLIPSAKPIRVGREFIPVAQALQPMGRVSSVDHQFHAESFLRHASAPGDDEKTLEMITTAELRFDGSVFAAERMTFDDMPKSGPFVLNFGPYEQEVIRQTASYIRLLRSFGVGGPFAVGVSLLRVRNYLIRPEERTGRHPMQILAMDDLRPEAAEVPEGIEDARDVAVAIRPALDHIWGAAGWPDDPFFGPDGRYNQFLSRDEH